MVWFTYVLSILAGGGLPMLTDDELKAIPKTVGNFRRICFKCP